MKRIIIQYSEDLREGKVVQQVFARLKNNGLEPIKVHSTYYPTTGTGEAEYVFDEKVTLPQKSELEKILEGMKLEELNAWETEEATE